MVSKKAQERFGVKSSDAVSLKHFSLPDLILISCPGRILDSPVNFVAFTTFLWFKGRNASELALGAILGKIMPWPIGHIHKDVCIFMDVSRAGSVPYRRNISSAAVNSFRVLEQSRANELPANAPSMLMTVSKGTSDKVIFNRMNGVSEY